MNREAEIRISPAELFSDEADYRGPLSTADVRDARIRRRMLSPLALVMPAIAGVIAALVSVAFLRKPPSIGKLWLVVVPLFLAGYAAYALWYFVTKRRHIVELIAPSVQSDPIAFYVTESASDAEDLLREIRATLGGKNG